VGLQHAPTLGHGEGTHATPPVHVPPWPVQELRDVVMMHSPLVLLQQAPLAPHTKPVQLEPARQVPEVHWYASTYTVQLLVWQQLPAVTLKVEFCCGSTAQEVFGPSQEPPAAPQAPWRITEHEPLLQQAPVAPQETVMQEDPSPWYTAPEDAAHTLAITRSHEPFA
jgi:hypothetical protein